MELGDETDINNIIPRGIAFALRRLFRYKPNDGVACNMISYFRLKLNSGFSSEATYQVVLRELNRMVVNHLFKYDSQNNTYISIYD